MFVFSHLCFNCAHVCLRALSLHISCCFCNIYSMQMPVNAKVCVCVKSTLNICFLIVVCVAQESLATCSSFAVSMVRRANSVRKCWQKALIFKCPKCSKVIRRVIHHTNKKEVHRMRLFNHEASCRSPDHAEQGIEQLELVDCTITQVWASQQVTREEVNNQAMVPYNSEDSDWE